MTQTLFDRYNGFLERHYNRKASVKTFNEFVDYCREGKEVNGVKPFMNPVNLYAFGTGMSSEQVMNLIFEVKEI